MLGQAMWSLLLASCPSETVWKVMERGASSNLSGSLLLPLPFLGLVELLTLLLLPIVLVLKFVNVEAPDVSVEAADV